MIICRQRGGGEDREDGERLRQRRDPDQTPGAPAGSGRPRERGEDQKTEDHTDDPRKPEDHAGGPLDLPGNGPEGRDRREGTETAGSPPRGAPSGDPTDNTATEEDDVRRGGHRRGGRRPRRDVRRQEDHVGDVGELTEDHTGGPLDRSERSRPGRRFDRAEIPAHERRQRGPEDHTDDPRKPEDHTGGQLDLPGNEAEGRNRHEGTETGGSPTRPRGAPSGEPRDNTATVEGNGRRGGRRPRRDVRRQEDHVEDLGELPEDHTGGQLDRPERSRPGRFDGAEKPERERRREIGPDDHTASPDDVLQDHTGRSDEKDDRDAGRRGRGSRRGGAVARQGRGGRRE